MRKVHFNSYLKARNFVSKGCVYQLVWVNYSSVEIPPIYLVSIKKEFLEVFLDNLQESLLREINIDIDLLPYARPISILA